MWGSRRVGGNRPRPRTVWRATGSASQKNGKEEKEKKGKEKKLDQTTAKESCITKILSCFTICLMNVKMENG